MPNILKIKKFSWYSILIHRYLTNSLFYYFILIFDEEGDLVVFNNNDCFS